MLRIRRTSSKFISLHCGTAIAVPYGGTASMERTKKSPPANRKGMISFFATQMKLRHSTTISQAAASHLVEEAMKLLPSLPVLFM